MNYNLTQSESSFVITQKKELLDWLESLSISKYWLDTMSYNDSYALCKEIYWVLKNFNQIDLPEKEKLLSLIEIDSCLHSIHKKLQRSYLDSTFPLNKKQRKNINMIIYIYMALVNAYYDIIVSNKITKVKLSEQFIALNICKGLQGLGVVFLTSAQSYSATPKGFWLLCYRLFGTSEELNLLDNKVEIDNKIYSAAILYKKLIIFYIFDKNQLSPREIEGVFQSLLSGINYIQNYGLTKSNIEGNSRVEVFGFSLDKDEAPSIQNNVLSTTAKLLRYVEKSEVIKIVKFLLHETKKHQQKNVLKTEVFERILTALVNKNQKRETRINKQRDCCVIIGLDNLIDFLLEKEGKKPLTPASKKNSSYENEEASSSLEKILDFDYEEEPIVNSILIENLQIVDSSISGYGISWNKNIAGNLQIGEAIGIIPDFKFNPKKIEIGLIRRVKKNGDNIIFGVELIGLESTLIFIERDNDCSFGEWAVFLFGLPNYDVGVLCHKERNYQEGQPIFVQLTEQKVSCHLGAILNSTPLLDHITLSY